MHAAMRRVVKPRIGIATRAPTEIATPARKLSGRERVIIPYTAVAREKPTTQTAHCSVRSIHSESLSYASTRSRQSRMASLTSSMTLSKPKAVRSVLRTTPVPMETIASTTIHSTVNASTRTPRRIWNAQLACTLMLPGLSLLSFPAAMCAGLERCLLHFGRSTAVCIAAAARILLLHLCSYLCNTCRGPSLGLRELLTEQP